MTRKFKIINPYGFTDDTKIYKYDNFEIKDNCITCLVGCNGSGKSTLFKEMQNQLDELGIKYTEHLATEAKDRLESAAFLHMNHEAQAYFSYSNWASEGEGIARRFEYLVQDIGHYVLTTCQNQNEAWIFLDSLDSGCSIDNIDEILDFLKNTVLGDKPEGLNMHIIIAVNSYAFLDNDYVKCLDVMTGQYVNFKTYIQYRNFVRASRKKKDKRG